MCDGGYCGIMRDYGGGEVGCGGGGGVCCATL